MQCSPLLSHNKYRIKCICCSFRYLISSAVNRIGGTMVSTIVSSAVDLVYLSTGVTYSFFPHTHFSPQKNEYNEYILSFPPGKMSIYRDFPPEK